MDSHQKRPAGLGHWLTLASAIAGMVFLTLPIAALIIRVLEQQAWQASPSSGIPQAIYLSFLTTLATMILTIIFGTPTAYFFARHKFPFKRFFNVLIELPIVLPPAVAGLALLVTFGRRGLLGPVLTQFSINLPFTTHAVILAQTFVSAPFYIRAAQVGFAGVSSEIEDAARVDGAAGWPLFWHITLPLTRRALGTGLTLSWARALGEFGATILFAGSLQGRTQTMPLLVYGVFERDIDAAIFVGLILIVLALGALLLSQALSHETDTD